MFSFRVITQLPLIDRPQGATRARVAELHRQQWHV